MEAEEEADRNRMRCRDLNRVIMGLKEEVMQEIMLREEDKQRHVRCAIFVHQMQMQMI